jgi:hypothetical protein
MDARIQGIVDAIPDPGLTGTGTVSILLLLADLERGDA